MTNFGMPKPKTKDWQKKLKPIVSKEEEPTPIVLYDITPVICEVMLRWELMRSVMLTPPPSLG